MLPSRLAMYLSLIAIVVTLKTALHHHLIPVLGDKNKHLLLVDGEFAYYQSLQLRHRHWARSLEGLRSTQKSTQVPGRYY